jgi:ABC-2 type transport system permease protein
MIKVWRIAAHEYARHVFRWRFLLGLLSLPGFVGLIALLIVLLVSSERDTRPVGYVDHSGILAGASAADDPMAEVEWVAFDSEEQAAEALEAGRVQAYFVLSAAYPQDRQVDLYSLEEPSETALDDFRELVRSRLLADRPPDIIRRILDGDRLEILSVDGKRRLSQGDWMGFFVPFLIGFAFLIAVFATTGYLMQAVIEEKENRTMEVVLTSVSPAQFMSGKILGIAGIGGTQILVWTGFILAFLLIGSLGYGWFELPRISAVYLVQVAAIFIPAFVMTAALMVAIGATVGEAQEAQQFTGLFTFPAFIPYWFSFQLMSNPHGPVAVGLSIFPLTAPASFALRAGFAEIPMWQFLISLGLLIACALGAIWLAGRAFRLGMLRYGQRLTWREIFARSSRPEAQRVP